MMEPDHWKYFASGEVAIIQGPKSRQGESSLNGTLCTIIRAAASNRCYRVQCHVDMKQRTIHSKRLFKPGTSIESGPKMASTRAQHGINNRYLQKLFEVCAHGSKCRFIRNGQDNCLFYYSDWELMSAKQSSEEIKPKECMHGARCRFVRNGKSTCLYYHTPEEVAESASSVHSKATNQTQPPVVGEDVSNTKHKSGEANLFTKSCKYGARCRFVRNGKSTCLFYHPPEEVEQSASSVHSNQTTPPVLGDHVSNTKHKSEEANLFTKSCKYGARCRFIRNGKSTCLFYHPPEEIEQSALSVHSKATNQTQPPVLGEHVSNTDHKSEETNLFTKYCKYGAHCRFIRNGKSACLYYHTLEELASSVDSKATHQTQPPVLGEHVSNKPATDLPKDPTNNWW